MGNGANEPVEFTRGDAERLIGINLRQTTIDKNLENLIKKFDEFALVQHDKHRILGKQIEANTRFRQVIIKISLWIFTTGAGLGLLAVGAKAVGWIN